MPLGFIIALRMFFAFALVFSLARPADARAGDQGQLIIATGGASEAVIVVAPGAGPWETKAAADLSKYIAKMAGPSLPVATAPRGNGPTIFVGKSALAADPRTVAALTKAVKKNPVVQGDAISIRRDGNRLYVAGSNDESHYFAVSWLLQHWGCRWYMPTDFGEVIPSRPTLSLGSLDFAYAPPFEIRRYWISWNGEKQGHEDFQRRNFMSAATMPGYAHALDQYTKDIAPAGGSHWNVPFADPGTAQHVAAKIEQDYAAGKHISLAIADGIYANAHPADRALEGVYDPYFLKPSLTDAMLTLYNDVGRRLRAKYPKSGSKIGGMAYGNVTLPPAKIGAIEPNIVMWIAPIDIDPNHAMDDPRSPSRRAYGDMVRRWSTLLEGRLAVYDYDQGMLVWRDLPNPSHHVFAKEVRLYRQAGILGFQTESRGALATTFLNLFFRGQLMWNPEADVDALLKEFYAGFYGPAAAPMSRYWGRLFAAWERTGVTEHEFFAIPAIYTPALVAELRGELEAAEAALTSAPASSQNSAMFQQRMQFTRASFEMINSYVATGLAAARDADYAAAVRAGGEALKAQAALRAINPLFVSGIIGGEDGHAWLAGEVRQYSELQSLTDGTKGTLLQRLEPDWWFKLEAELAPGWRYTGLEGATPKSDARLALELPSAASGWTKVRTDLYLQAQGVRSPSGRHELGHYWVASSFTLPSNGQAGATRIMFPGLFNEAWLTINGELVAHRSYNEPWWQGDYRFEWDVDISKYLRPGVNRIAVRGFNPHHAGGMFRRPFLYRPRPAN